MKRGGAERREWADETDCDKSCEKEAGKRSRGRPKKEERPVKEGPLKKFIVRRSDMSRVRAPKKADSATLR